MNQDKQFLKYVPVTGEKHLGIAIVRYFGKIILRYKVMASQEGGYWVSPGSAKIGVKRDGKDNYEEWFQLDSSFDRDEMKDFILSHVEPILAQKQGSVFAPQPAYGAQPQAQYHAQPNPNYQPPAQQQSFLPPEAPQGNWDNPPF